MTKEEMRKAAWAEWQKEVCPVRIEYDMAIAPAAFEYQNAVAPAEAEFRKAVASLRAEYVSFCKVAEAKYHKRLAEIDAMPDSEEDLKVNEAIAFLSSKGLTVS